MKRRDSLKLLATGAIAAPAILAGCKNEDDKPKEEIKETKFSLDRNKDEQKYEESLLKEKFFTDHEMATITVLADIIIPKDDVSGSASEAKVPEFIGFIVKDMPSHQLPMRGGLRWLDMESLKRFEKPFVDLDSEQRLQIVDDIAYPEIKYKEQNGREVKKGNVKSEMKPGIAFFNLMRNLTATGFYTSEIGLKDVGYLGNKPGPWNGVPDDVLKQYGLAYDEKELRESVKF
jgi:gluconate 2-dehydrogenase gamma chain